MTTARCCTYEAQKEKETKTFTHSQAKKEGTLKNCKEAGCRTSQYISAKATTANSRETVFYAKLRKYDTIPITNIVFKDRL